MNSFALFEEAFDGYDLDFSINQRESVEQALRVAFLENNLEFFDSADRNCTESIITMCCNYSEFIRITLAFFQWLKKNEMSGEELMIRLNYFYEAYKRYFDTCEVVNYNNLFKEIDQLTPDTAATFVKKILEGDAWIEHDLSDDSRKECADFIAAAFPEGTMKFTTQPHKLHSTVVYCGKGHVLLTQALNIIMTEFMVADDVDYPNCKVAGCAPVVENSPYVGLLLDTHGKMYSGSSLSFADLTTFIGIFCDAMGVKICDTGVITKNPVQHISVGCLMDGKEMHPLSIRFPVVIHLTGLRAYYDLGDDTFELRIDHC